MKSVSFDNTNESTQSGKQIGVTVYYPDGTRMLLYTDYDLGLCLYDPIAASRVYLLPRKRLLFTGTQQLLPGNTHTIAKPEWFSKCNMLCVMGYAGGNGSRGSVEIGTGSNNCFFAGVTGSEIVCCNINVNTTGTSIVLANNTTNNVGSCSFTLTRIYAWHD